MSQNRLATPLNKLYEWEKTTPQALAFRQPHEGEWINYTWQETGQNVRKLAAALKTLSLPEKSKIAILSKNCAHWMMADWAIAMAGHISVPLYPNMNAETIQYILKHSESKAIFIGKLDDWSSLQSGVVSQDIARISFPLWPMKGCIPWSEFVEPQSPLKNSPPRGLSELATIIYTSGTTGFPKGVMHNFESLAYSGTQIVDQFQLGPKDRFFSYLPLAHVAERVLTQTCALYCGGTTWFAQSIETFGKNIQETKPTVFLAVPRIWTKFQMGILQKLPQNKLDLFLAIPGLSWFIRHKIKKNLGLLHAKYVITGAAPISDSLVIWYKKLGLELQEGYGLTENFAYSHISPKGKTKVGFVGTALPGVEIKTSDQDEILVKSKANMDGYFKDPDLTSQVLKDGFLHTGDIGEIDPQGYLKLTGRVKELFKTSKGKYIAPSPIELQISKSPWIDQVNVTGVGLPQPIALILLSAPGKELGKESITQKLSEFLIKINQIVEPYERLKKFVILDQEWTVENSFLTPTMKIKRSVIEKEYGPFFEKWFHSEEIVLFEKSL
jgi:long-subunit acyl-CoA synthetase (AMP-forming)